MHSLNLSVEFIKKHGGAWFVNAKLNTPNYNSLYWRTINVVLNAQLNSNDRE